MKCARLLLPRIHGTLSQPPCTSSLSTESRQGILVLNAGSSSLKFNLFSLDTYPSLSIRSVLSGAANGLTVTGDVTPTVKIKKGSKTVISDTIPSPTHSAGLSYIADSITAHSSEDIVAVGHRVVHGGTLFPDSSIMDISAVEKLTTLSSLAPLHNPHNLAGILAAKQIFPHALQVGVFDTGYHSTIPEYAFTYPLPRHLATKYRRYGFHGTSHKYVAEKAAQFLGVEKINAISMHLGNGGSVACIKENESIDTTMGYTPLAGLPMGSRSGDIDPSIIIKLLKDEGYSIDEVSDILHNKSGLYGLSGSSDSLTVERGYNTDPDSTLAFNVFAYSARKSIGAYTAVLNNKVDCIIFTGGIGENSPLLHSLVCEGLYPLSTRDMTSQSRDMTSQSRDKTSRDMTSRDSAVTEISSTGSKPRVLVVKTNEELAIAKECVRLMGLN